MNDPALHIKMQNLSTTTITALPFLITLSHSQFNTGDLFLRDHQNDMIDQISSQGAMTKPNLVIRTNHSEKILIYTFLFLFASIGNSTSFVALLFMNKNTNKNFKNSRSRIRLLLMNLCIADLMVTYIHLPLEIIWAYTDSWLAGETMCKLMMFLRTFGHYLSSFVIITITIDRFYVIVKPLELEKVYTLNKILLTLSWLMSFLSSLPQVFVFELLAHPLDPTFKQCVTFGKLNTKMKKLIYSLYHFIGCYGAPLLIMCFCYFKIFSTIATHTKTNRENRDSNSKAYYQFLHSHNNRQHVDNQRYTRYMYKGRHYQGYGRPFNRRNILDGGHLVAFNSDNFRRNNNNTFMKAKYRTLKLSALIVLAYLFSWTPYYLCLLWAIADPNAFNNSKNNKIKNYLFTFAVSNSCLNPYIYGIFLNKLYRFLPCIEKKHEKKNFTKS
ncbi:unnamed protein product [Brachionus calyciflorus]|uniref:G-protein coupled receptors family 1 profile domain-containing protein n=1 Tax=Brachionus calyciflorus TaxID=104777 RepID=A0A813TNK6_9BILA|nr:unnamed protein product [Brachionus calyciflorus]